MARTDAPGAIEEAIRKVRQSSIPAPEKIVAEAFEQLGYTTEALKPREIQKNFNRMLREVFEKTLEVLEKYEEPAYGIQMVEELCAFRSKHIEQAKNILRSSQDLDAGFLSAVKYLLRVWYPDLRKMFLSISQSRKARGGRDFELVLGRLFDMMEIPYERKKRTYRADFMIPSEAAFDKERTRCVIISAKRTLRERWREVVEELYNMRSPNVYLATADEEISMEKVESIADHNVHLVVWDEVKAREFADNPMVLSYTELADKVLPTFKRFWKGVQEGPKKSKQ